RPTEVVGLRVAVDERLPFRLAERSIELGRAPPKVLVAHGGELFAACVQVPVRSDRPEAFGPHAEKSPVKRGEPREARLERAAASRELDVEILQHERARAALEELRDAAA